MKKIALILFLCAATAAPLLADDAAAGTNADGGTTTSTNVFNSERQRASYALGMMLGHNWKEQGVDVDFDIVAKGFKDEQSGGPTLMTPEEMSETLKEYQKTVAAEQQKKRELIAAENKKAGEEFLAQNKTKSGVKTLPDGLEYKVISEGKGPSPGPDDIVTVNYRGTLLGGTEFDGTAKLGHPREFPVNKIIPGWSEALQMMKPGSVWELYIPSDLAYGAAGHPPQIPPNATLVFSVQLISSRAPGTPPPSASTPPLTSDIIAVPSAEELKKGKKPYTLKPDQVQKLQEEMQKTNR